MPSHSTGENGQRATPVTEQEIASQPAMWQQALSLVEEARTLLGAPGERVLAIGCGTSAFVAMAYAVLRERAGLGETDAAYASEVPAGRRYDRVVAITRSGTTTEILDALARVPVGQTRVAVTAVTGQAVDAVSDERLLLDFADESSVVQTRFPTTLLALVRAALGEDLSGALADCQTAVAGRLPVDPGDFDQFVFLGTGWTVGLAHEAALKVREAAQAWSESYPAMDYRHGPIAVADRPHPGLDLRHRTGRPGGRSPGHRCDGRLTTGSTRSRSWCGPSDWPWHWRPTATWTRTDHVTSPARSSWTTPRPDHRPRGASPWHGARVEAPHWRVPQLPRCLLRPARAAAAVVARATARRPPPGGSCRSRSRTATPTSRPR